ncbi:phosphotransferase [Teredinibacter sp. KSP-S5-2]|uniref:phosphotransferase n=1 Tax=Teredinibacter sp. KSP-S5-2 TaxID=3034506 RepID=UPI002935169F|nr:phosphotransferase [Teredinibacter sp. KSP-S5-2]WNO07808.1 phosphotransferase [Teredinibacter sp. KSP-S5-2]
MDTKNTVFDVEALICKACNADSAFALEDIQSLWSGYGVIRRYAVNGASVPSVVVKHIVLPEQSQHPRGWNTAFSHQRKLNSYRVESHWYRDWNHLCDRGCPTAKAYWLEERDSETIIIMEDLDAAGFALRKDDANLNDMQQCLSWLASFHACFMVEAPQVLNVNGLWEQGCYWHLATRPDELQALQDSLLKKAAPLIDKALNASPFQTLVHGDAKLANFCFAENGKNVAAVDFQYVGAGCGMKDVAYFISSCLDESTCEKMEKTLLDFYFSALGKELVRRKKTIAIEKLEANWRPLYAYAWADFYRFLKGWSPGHWKVHRYSNNLCRHVIQQLNIK